MIPRQMPCAHPIREYEREMSTDRTIVETCPLCSEVFQRPRETRP